MFSPQAAANAAAVADREREAVQEKDRLRRKLQARAGKGGADARCVPFRHTPCMAACGVWRGAEGPLCCRLAIPQFRASVAAAHLIAMHPHMRRARLRTPFPSPETARRAAISRHNTGGHLPDEAGDAHAHRERRAQHRKDHPPTAVVVHPHPYHGLPAVSYLYVIPDAFVPSDIR